MIEPVVIDTNVLVAGLLTGDGRTPTARHGMIRECLASPLAPPHAADAHLFGLAATHPGARTVTGDRALLEDPGTRPWTMTPSDFAARLP